MFSPGQHPHQPVRRSPGKGFRRLEPRFDERGSDEVRFHEEQNQWKTHLEEQKLNAFYAMKYNMIHSSKKYKPSVTFHVTFYLTVANLFIKRIGELQLITVACSAQLAYNFAALPQVRCYSFVVPRG
jgi:hypothetical protein